MACLINGGLSKECTYSLAGVDTLYLGNHGSFTYNKDNTGLVTGITATSGATFYKFDFNDDTAIGTSDLTLSNGRKYINQTVTFGSDVAGLEAIEIYNSLGLSKVDAILKTREGELQLYGEYGGLLASAGQFTTGGALGDAAGATFTLAGAAKSFATILSPSIDIPL